MKKKAPTAETLSSKEEQIGEGAALGSPFFSRELKAMSARFCERDNALLGNRYFILLVFVSVILFSWGTPERYEIIASEIARESKNLTHKINKNK